MAPTKNDRDGVKETFEYGIETFFHQNDDSFFSHAPKILSEQEWTHIPYTDIFKPISLTIQLFSIQHDKKQEKYFHKSFPRFYLIVI